MSITPIKRALMYIHHSKGTATREMVIHDFVDVNGHYLWSRIMAGGYVKVGWFGKVRLTELGRLAMKAKDAEE